MNYKAQCISIITLQAGVKLSQSSPGTQPRLLKFGPQLLKLGPRLWALAVRIWAQADIIAALFVL